MYVYSDIGIVSAAGVHFFVAIVVKDGHQFVAPICTHHNYFFKVSQVSGIGNFAMSTLCRKSGKALLAISTRSRCILYPVSYTQFPTNMDCSRKNPQKILLKGLNFVIGRAIRLPGTVTAALSRITVRNELSRQNTGYMPFS